MSATLEKVVIHRAKSSHQEDPGADRLRALTQGVEVDPDDALSPDDE